MVRLPDTGAHWFPYICTRCGHIEDYLMKGDSPRDERNHYRKCKKCSNRAIPSNLYAPLKMLQTLVREQAHLRDEIMELHSALEAKEDTA